MTDHAPAAPSYDDVRAAAGRIAGRVRPVAVVPAGEGLWFALEQLQHTGSFKARGARNFIAAHRETGTLPAAGVTIASGGNAGLACAWAARGEGVPATVFLPESAPRVKVDKLRSYGADVRLAGTEYAEALAACEEFGAGSGALVSHAYDHPLIAAGAGTLLDEIRDRLPELDTVVVSAGGGGLFTGVAVAALAHGVRVLVVEPENCRALNAGLTAGHPVDVPVRSIAADALGARRASWAAVRTAARPGVTSLLVPDAAIAEARRALWEEHRLVVEHAAATAYAGLAGRPGEYGKQVAVVLCGANTDPSDLAV
ncbi:serine/threonine dehydratase [Streptomyces sp. NPDC089919]|uniref:serine/threonine dehydratase n=1 Tax=Streptomyces sp. NPDC089919 TaxID=3155188 RepID=UPI0034444A96